MNFRYLPPECFELSKTPMISSKVSEWFNGVFIRTCEEYCGPKLCSMFRLMYGRLVFCFTKCYLKSDPLDMT